MSEVERRCDIVMKGGVTSGIVYPPAILEIARAFRFVNIGGTSAGAIAASLTAAAEYRRHNGGGLAGFERLARVPTDLAENHALLGLFAPNASTALAFDEIMAFIRCGSPAEVVKRIATLPFRSSKRRVAWTFVTFGVVLAIVELGVGGPSALAGAVATVLLGTVVGSALSLWQTLRSAIACVVANQYGLASGVDEKDPDNGHVLGVWLGRLLDEVAGLEPGDHLTFGHLWYGRPPTTNDAEHRPSDAENVNVNLEMVSTCISQARPYTFPTGTNVFYFQPNVLERYLPADIVAMMVTNARDPEENGHSYPAEALLPYLRMPVDRDLPVVLAARMSLAFPLLLSAVELGAAPYVESTNADSLAPQPKPKPVSCWFADGGLSSNFPIHMFDGPLPRWPTFGINLSTFDAHETDYDPANESNNVAMPIDNKTGLAERWSFFSSLVSYLGATFNAVKDWNDNVQLRLPGFRDRIVTIKLRRSEGGLNLDMGPEKIRPLVARGRAAGALLVKRFAVPSVGTFAGHMDWENHRVVRYRVAMSSLQRYAAMLAKGYEGGQPGDASYDDLLAAAERHNFRPYPWGNKSTRVRAREITRQAADLSRRLRQEDVDFTDHAPKPQPDLVKRPRY